MPPMKMLFLLFAALILAACGGSASDDGATPEQSAPTAVPEPSGDAVAGETLYSSSCSACHGPDATGIAGLGKDLTTSPFIATQSDEALLAFVKTGRPSGDPENTTGIDMPPKGGNPALTDAQINDIIAYLRTLER